MVLEWALSLTISVSDVLMIICIGNTKVSMLCHAISLSCINIASVIHPSYMMSQMSTNIFIKKLILSAHIFMSFITYYEAVRNIYSIRFTRYNYVFLVFVWSRSLLLMSQCQTPTQILSLI